MEYVVVQTGHQRQAVDSSRLDLIRVDMKGRLERDPFMVLPMR